MIEPIFGVRFDFSAVRELGPVLEATGKQFLRYELLNLANHGGRSQRTSMRLFAMSLQVFKSVAGGRAVIAMKHCVCEVPFDMAFHFAFPFHIYRLTVLELNANRTEIRAFDRLFSGNDFEWRWRRAPERYVRHEQRWLTGRFQSALETAHGGKV